MTQRNTATAEAPAETIAPENETDHEFRLRMAREGRAIYVPGKTDAEVRAARTAEKARREAAHRLDLDLSLSELDALDKALPDLMALVSDAGRAFDFLAAGFVLGHFDSDDVGVIALMRLSSRALTLAEDRECPAVDVLDTKLRQSRRALEQGTEA